MFSCIPWGRGPSRIVRDLLMQYKHNYILHRYVLRTLHKRTQNTLCNSINSICFASTRAIPLFGYQYMLVTHILCIAHWQQKEKVKQRDNSTFLSFKERKKFFLLSTYHPSTYRGPGIQINRRMYEI
jgi:hypothetical protein